MASSDDIDDAVREILPLLADLAPEDWESLAEYEAEPGAEKSTAWQAEGVR